MKNKNLKNVFFILSMVFFLGSWVLLRIIIQSQGIEKIWLLPVLFLLDFVFFSMFVLLSKSMRANLFLAWICVLGSVLMIFGSLALVTSSIVICLGLFYFGIKRIKEQQRNNVKLNLYITLRRGVPIWGLAMSILISVGFYSYLEQNQRSSKIPVVKIEIPQGVTDKLIGLASTIVSKEDFKLISEGATVDDYVESLIISQNGLQKGNFQNVQQGDLKSSTKEGREMLSSQLGLELKGEEKMNEVADKVLEMRLNELINGQTSSEPLMPLAAATALFIVASSLFWFLGFAAIWTSMVIFYILLKLHKVAINIEERKVEIID